MTEERVISVFDVYLFIFKCIENQPWTKFNAFYDVKTYAVTSSREEWVTSKTLFFSWMMDSTSPYFSLSFG